MNSVENKKENIDEAIQDFNKQITEALGEQIGDIVEHAIREYETSKQVGEVIKINNEDVMLDLLQPARELRSKLYDIINTHA